MKLVLKESKSGLPKAEEVNQLENDLYKLAPLYAKPVEFELVAEWVTLYGKNGEAARFLKGDSALKPIPGTNSYRLGDLVRYFKIYDNIRDDVFKG